MKRHAKKLTRPLKVAVIGFNERNLNMLRMFFESKGASHAVVVDESEAEAGIVDLDGIEAPQVWQRFTRTPMRPSLVLSVSERTLPKAIWVRKPLNLETFLDAVTQLRQAYLDDSDSAENAPQAPAKAAARVPPQAPTKAPPKAAPSPASPPRRAEAAAAKAPAKAAPVPPRPIPPTGAAAPASSPAKQPEPAHRKAPASIDPKQIEAAVNRAAQVLRPSSEEDDYYRRDLHGYYGDREDSFYLDPSQREQLFYDPDKFIQGKLALTISDARRSGVPLRLDGLGKPLVLLPDRNGLVTDMRDQYLRSLCTQPSHILQIRVAHADPRDIRMAEGRTVRRNDCTLWNVALWTSRGRVPVGTPLDRPITLKRWPNFTRLASPPHALQIVAHWSRHSSSLMDTARALKAPYRAVFGVYSACWALGLVTPERSGAQSVVHGGMPLADVPEDTRRELFDALLRKLG